MNKYICMKKLKSLIIGVFAMVSIASAASLTTDVVYKTKVLDKGNVIFENAVVAGAQAEHAGFVVGINTFNTTEANTVGKATSSSGLLKRVDILAGYKFTALLADLTLGAAYKNFSKSAQINSVASNSEPFVKLNGNLYRTELKWDATARADIKNHSNNIETNVKWPVGFKHLKVVPAIGFGFNDPGAATIAAFKDSKRYVIAGIGFGYYTKYAVVSADFYQRRDTLTAAGNSVNGIASGLHFKY